jgi:uncharacterized protein
MLTVEIACAINQEVILIPVQVPEGTTVMEAIELSGLAKRLPQLFPVTAGLGIYGKACSGSTLLRDGDRVEICRPLKADPKEARRNRAARRTKPAS